MVIVAIDLGKFNSMDCVYDSDSQETHFETLAAERGYFKSLFNSYSPDLVVVEACGPSGWVSDLCGELDTPVLACSTHEKAWLRKNVKRKTDKDDALKLARLASLKELVPTHVPVKTVRERRRLINYRKKIVNRINSSKSTIRSTFMNQRIVMSSGAKTWHSGRIDLIEQAKPLSDCKPDELWRGELEIELHLLETLESQLEVVEKKLNDIAGLGDDARQSGSRP